MRNRTIGFFVILLSIVLNPAKAQMVFDDFSYESSDDAAFGTFNRWKVINGINGPPEGSSYLKSNVTFTIDPNDADNILMGLTSSCRNTVPSTTNARVESIDMNYGPGSYAARIYFDNTPRDFQDPSVQTFYTITSWEFANDPDQYAEVDFEYLPWDAWSGDYGGGYDAGMFMTPWESSTIRTHILKKQDFSGWHTLLFSFTDGVNVKFYIDGQFMGQISKTEGGVSIYPDNTMYACFANWLYTIDKATLGPSTDLRSSTMLVDWFVYIKDQAKTTTEVETIVSGFRTEGIERKNILGQVYGKGILTPIEASTDNNVVSLYPNPAGDHLHLKLEPGFQYERITVTDMQGKDVWEEEASVERSIDTTSWRAGIYAVKIFTKDGRSFIKRFNRK